MSNSYVVLDGLKDGEEIVTNGTFSVDASAQLSGKPSMMNPEGGKTNTMPGMIMPGDDSKSNSSTENDQSGIKATGMTGKTNVNMDFIMQLNSVFDKYVILKNAFVQSNVKEVKLAANDVHLALTKADMKLLTGDAMAHWMELLPSLNNQVKHIASSDVLEEQRKIFSVFNDVFYKALKRFGLMGKTVYYQFCPMMTDGRGAYWLSETKDIRNPYYGEAMLTCGEIKETLKY